MATYDICYSEVFHEIFSILRYFQLQICKWLKYLFLLNILNKILISKFADDTKLLYVVKSVEGCFRAECDLNKQMTNEF